MSKHAADADARPELDQVLTDRAQGPAERAVLGFEPMGTMIRLVAFVLFFVLVGGSLFYWLNL
ncbi:hypothetical protein IC608_11550 [Devosia sp. PTR5]|jgi:hypothetical protein|uniref:Uncharacterized protein n=1 Tax=Devosia oryzisoli TaxID=2774138 RepID=A0A927ITP7_9HYPH|nr:hypothetical protein [Devosia oryzisoli]MBD8066107.1 hypothetical protein [Devosia oryzisoli]